jgi:hypothetical protein
MDETIRFFIGIALFLAAVTFEWFKERASKKTS